MGILGFPWVLVVLVGIKMDHRTLWKMSATQIMKTFLSSWSGLRLGVLCCGLGACHVLMTVGAVGHPEFQESERFLAQNRTRLQGLAWENRTLRAFLT